MSLLILGLVLFLGVHSLRIVADDWRTRQIARLGLLPWKGLYSLVSIVGFVLICWGFVLARQHPVLLYVPPLWLMRLNSVFTLLAFVLLAAYLVPYNQIKAKLHHPMVLAVKLWAFGHLLAIGMLRDVVLFGAFLLWAIVLFAASRRRDRREGTVYPSGSVAATIVTIVVGVLMWVLFAFWLHAVLIGVKPVM